MEASALTESPAFSFFQAEAAPEAALDAPEYAEPSMKDTLKLGAAIARAEKVETKKNKQILNFKTAPPPWRF
jgi:hypothetical protein